MKKWLCVSMYVSLCFFLSFPAIAADGTSSLQTDTSAAHSPHYDNRTLWPVWVTQTAFHKETWPPARLLVWAHTNTSDRGLDPMDPKNWLENGRPADRLFDENTDLLFPASDTRYVVGVKRQTLACRHITIENNAKVSLQKLTVHGNVWIKKGGQAIWIEAFTGSRHTFARNDNTEGREIRIANKLTLAKSTDASTEIIGCFETGDDLNLHSGSMIIGPDSTFMPGDRSVQGVYPDARLILLSGSRFHKRSNQHWNNELVVAGILLAGTPERPLTKSCYLGLSYKTKGRDVPSHQKGHPDDRGLVVLESGKFEVHSADPLKARLEIGWPGIVGGSFVKMTGTEDNEQEHEAFRAVPHKIDMVFLGDVKLNGVLFDHVLQGGIQLRNLDMFREWKNIFYGEHNAAAPDKLFQKYKGPTEFKLKG